MFCLNSLCALKNTIPNSLKVSSRNSAPSMAKPGLASPSASKASPSPVLSCLQSTVGADRLTWDPCSECPSPVCGAVKHQWKIHSPCPPWALGLEEEGRQVLLCSCFLLIMSLIPVLQEAFLKRLSCMVNSLRCVFHRYKKLKGSGEIPSHPHPYCKAAAWSTLMHVH